MTVATLAVAYDGLPTAKVDLNDAGVWLTKTSSLLVGHFNHESTVLDGGLRAAGDDYNVLQDASTVLVVDHSSKTMTTVDPARVALTDSATIPASSKVALGARTTAVLDRTSGDLWVKNTASISGFDIKGTDPVAKLGKGADVVVAQDGTVFGLSADRGEVVTVPVDAQGDPQEPRTASVGEIDTSAPASITAVGDTPVVLDAGAGVVTTPGGFRTELSGLGLGAVKDAVLQQASGETSAVTLAGKGELVEIPLDGSKPTVVRSGGSGEGVPAAPVFLRGCTYGAWGGSARFVRDCAGTRDDVAADIPGAQESSRLAFRVNRDVIVLNDVVGGEAWLADQSLQRVDDWSILTPPEGDTQNQDESTQETVETSLPDRKKQNTPPVAEDDPHLGARPGGTTLLPVLDNDNDSDGDVLVASLDDAQPKIGQVQPILNGAALQIDVPADATGSATFRYKVDDGRENGTDTAKATVTVYPWDVNTAPKPKRKVKLSVEAGGTLSYNILQDWIDPEGDDLYLRSVVAAPGDEVTFTTDGQMTYRALGSLQGRKEVQVIVSDALGESATGKIMLDVKPAGTTVPVTNADHVVTRVGETATVSPLANDVSSGRDELRLSRVAPLEGAVITPDYTKKQFSFSAPAAGVYYVQYQVSAGAAGAKGIVRVDVLDKQESQLPPVAVRDVALLPSGKEALVDVLANDSDPAGGVLVVQSVSVPPHSGVAVSVLNHQLLRISDQGAVDKPVKITYRISNGQKSAEGDVTVVPIPAPSKLEPPVAHDDEAVVRVGDVVTIPVLENDVHPNGDALHLEPKLVEPLVDPKFGEAFVSQNTVRFKAGNEPRTVYLTYEVSDSMGQKAGGHVTVQILPVDAKVNAAPHPRDLTARALAGTSIRIPIPLDGIDTDGDSVELLGQDHAPVKGRITETGSNYLEYQAFADSTGVDTFTYRVRDRLGAEGTATVRVGIAPPEAMNQAPYAVKDAVVVRPGRSVAVPVLANDSDPEGDAISLFKNGLEVPAKSGLKAKVSGDRVIVTVPDHEMEASLRYSIQDSKGARADAPILVTVSKDVPLMRPIARDDRVRVENLKKSLTTDVDILGNDEDPDGTAEALKVTVEDGAKLVGGKARVTVGEKRQLIRYTVTDQDGLTASAFIFVPSISELRPTLSKTKPVEVRSGETKVLPLADYVTVAGGGTVRLTEASKVSAGHANGDALIKDEKTLVYTSKKGYFGDDALNFEVTDGKTVEDPKGRRSTLSIPIKVLPPANQPPVFVNGQVDVAPGEKAIPVDLAALTTDPDKGDAGKIKYKIEGQPSEGVSAHLQGNTLMVEAGSSTPKGTTTTVGLSISDGTTEPVKGNVTVRVTASTRSLAVASPDTVPQADQGKTILVPVLNNDINPFAADGTPLKIVSTDLETGEGSQRIVGDQVEITPAQKFVGVMVVRYRIQDATKDPDREVDGRVTVTVQGVPDAPGVPQVNTVEDRTVVLSWSAPSNNGAEIDHYTVTSVGGRPFTKTCETTTCTLDGLTNNVEYTFKVTAHNRVGDGPDSPLSGPARPDVRPETPLPPKLVFGDKSLKVSWTTPQSNGSPVDSYTLRISPAPLNGPSEKTGVTGNSLTWEGLENGTSYQVQVQAHNKAPTPSDFSMLSQAEVPAGKPGVLAAPTVANAPSVGTEAQMTVKWGNADPNGAAITNYDLLVYHGGALAQTIHVGTATSKVVSVGTSTTAYTYAVRSTNKAGDSPISPQSAPQRASGTPQAPTGVKATEGDQKITVTFTPMSDAQRNGATPGEMRYQYKLSNGGWTDWNGTSAIGATNGTEYSVQVRAYSVVAGQPSQPGAASAPSNKVIPYGAPHAPTGSASKSGDKQINLTWNASGSDNGRPVTTEISIDGGAWQKVGISGNRVVGNGYNQTHSISVKVTASAGGSANGGPWKATTSAPPAPRIWVTRGDFHPSCVNGCYTFKVNWENANLGVRDVYCSADNDSHFAGPYSINFNGSGSQTLSCWHGQDNMNVWADVVGWGGAVDTETSYWGH